MLENATMEEDLFKARSKVKTQINGWCLEEVDDGSLVPVDGIRESPLGVIPDPEPEPVEA